MSPQMSLTDREIKYLKDHAWHDVLHDKKLYGIFVNDYHLMKWLEGKILNTAAQFKVRYLKDEQTDEPS